MTMEVLLGCLDGLLEIVNMEGRGIIRGGRMALEEHRLHGNELLLQLKVRLAKGFRKQCHSRW